MFKFISCIIFRIAYIDNLFPLSTNLLLMVNGDMTSANLVWAATMEQWILSCYQEILVIILQSWVHKYLLVLAWMLIMLSSSVWYYTLLLFLFLRMLYCSHPQLSFFLSTIWVRYVMMLIFWDQFGFHLI